MEGHDGAQVARRRVLQEATVRIAKADLVPTDANLLPAYNSFAELADADRAWCDSVNTRRHRATGQISADRLDIERTTLHVLPVEPLALALERVVGSDRTISFNSVRYSTPTGYTSARVWCRVVGEELSIIARTSSGDLSEIWRHQLSTPGVRQIIDAHYPDHPDGGSVHQPSLQPRSEAEIAFVGIGPGAASWPGVDVVGDQRVMIDFPSQLPEHLLAASAGRRLVLHAMHSVVDWLAFAVWEDGRLLSGARRRCAVCALRVRPRGPPRAR